jgi:hypothetical protein
MMAFLAPGQAPQLPELEETPPVGFSVKLSPGHLDTDMVVPAEVLDAVAELVQKVIAAQRQAAGGPQA